LAHSYTPIPDAVDARKLHDDDASGLLSSDAFDDICLLEAEEAEERREDSISLP
jgi:hypothetical protein